MFLTGTALTLCINSPLFRHKNSLIHGTAAIVPVWYIFVIPLDYLKFIRRKKKRRSPQIAAQKPKRNGILTRNEWMIL